MGCSLLIIYRLVHPLKGGGNEERELRCGLAFAMILLRIQFSFRIYPAVGFQSSMNQVRLICFEAKPTQCGRRMPASPSGCKQFFDGTEAIQLRSFSVPAA
jgi:hypothetical protein